MNTTSIPSSVIREYLFSKFLKNHKIGCSNSEFLTSSIFSESQYGKYHLSINLETGLWQDFKAGVGGNFVQLYAALEGISYTEASIRLKKSSLFRKKASVVEPTQKIIQLFSLDEEAKPFLPIKLSDVEKYADNSLELTAWIYLFKRKLFNLEKDENFFVAKEGRYKDRLIIPVYKENILVYFQGRALLGTIVPKYLNPGRETGVKSSYVLYEFDESKDYVVICEGPIDAISLKRRGVNATCTFGSNTSEFQLSVLTNKPRQLIYGYDNDEAGYRGIEKANVLRKSKLIHPIYSIHPKTGYKDWNEMHCSENLDYESWILENAKEVNFNNSIRQKLTSL